MTDPATPPLNVVHLTKLLRGAYPNTKTLPEHVQVAREVIEKFGPDATTTTIDIDIDEVRKWALDCLRGRDWTTLSINALLEQADKLVNWRLGIPEPDPEPDSHGFHACGCGPSPSASAS